MTTTDLIKILSKYEKDSNGGSRKIEITDINNKMILSGEDDLIRVWVSEGESNEIRFYINKK